jgi:hypothetical protein
MGKVEFYRKKLNFEGDVRRTPNFFFCARTCVQCCIIFDIIVLNIEVGGKGEDGSHFDMMRSVA